MLTRIFLLPLLILVFTLNACSDKQVNSKLPRSVPEAEGVSSEDILDFLDAVSKSEHEIHSFMFLRHGKVIAEGWWDPYAPELKHTMYSTSKSFTSTAVGFAVNEDLISVTDRVISFFPGDLPDTLSSYLSELTISDLLSMSAGHDTDPTFKAISMDTNWVRAFLAWPIVHEPGSFFLYNTLGSYVLSAIVQEVSGEQILEYLTPRLFEPLGIQDADWETDPRDINTGGWGLRIRTEDMAKFGQLYLQKGSWKGQQVLPAEWIEEATTLKIEQAPDLTRSEKDMSDWLQGYCYQFWRSRHNSYRADGAYGQFIIILPEQDAVIVLTAETGDMQEELNLVWTYLLPAIKTDVLPENEATAQKLTQALSFLSLPAEKATDNPPLASHISDKGFKMDSNSNHIVSLSLSFEEEKCRLSITTDTGSFVFAFGSGEWLRAETAKPGPGLLSGSTDDITRLSPYKVAGCYRWNSDQELVLTLRYIESPHTQTFTCRFENNSMSLSTRSSNSPDREDLLLKGELIDQLP